MEEKMFCLNVRKPAETPDVRLPECVVKKQKLHI